LNSYFEFFLPLYQKQVMSKKKKAPSNKNVKKATSKKTQASSPSKKAAKPVQEINLESSFWVNQKMHLLLIFILSSVLYANTLGHKYAVDDSIVILRNEFTKKGFKGMPGIWMEDTFTGFFGKKKNLVAGGRYRPLSVATFAIELQLFGTPIVDKNTGKEILDKDGDVNYAGSPFISHFVNMLLYAWLCMVIYLMLLQMFNPKKEQNNLKGYFIALAGALLYASHPVHTEAVANIKGRDEIMVLLGSLLAVYWVLKAAAEDHSKALYYEIGAIIAFTFAIFSKENAVTFLAIIPAALYFFTKKQLPEILIKTVPYVIIVGIFWIGIRGQILGEGASVVSSTNAPISELMNDPFLRMENNKYIRYTTEERLATVLYTWGKYIKLLVYPEALTNDYYPKHIRTDLDKIPTFAMPEASLSLLFHLGLVLLLLFGIFKRKAYAFFILFYWATFSVVSNLLFAIGTNMAERFMFLPSVGFSAVCAMGLYGLINSSLARGKSLKDALRVPTVLLGVVVFLYSAKTIARNNAWYDDYTLFMTDIDNSPNSAKLNNAVSGVLQDSANRVTNLMVRKSMVEKALGHSITATQLHPTYNNAWLLRGNANVMLGGVKKLEGMNATNPTAKRAFFDSALKYYNEGIVAYNEVLKWRSDHPDVRRNMGVVYRDRGSLLGQHLQQIEPSIASIEKALTYIKTDFESFRLLGIAYGVRGMGLQGAGRLQEAVNSHYKAISYLEKALEINPNAVPILYNMEIAYRQLNQPEKIEAYNKRWKAIDPTYDPSKQQ
jgi:tetratricopeptide (TPR) repeat protein